MITEEKLVPVCEKKVYCISIRKKLIIYCIVGEYGPDGVK